VRRDVIQAGLTPFRGDVRHQEGRGRRRKEECLHSLMKEGKRIIYLLRQEECYVRQKKECTSVGG
jgi:hypothetical protein